MEENNKLEEMNTEPVVQLIIPRDNGQEKIFSITRKKGMMLAGLLAVVFVCLAGAAGFYGRDMSEIHTLETKLRRAVIQNSGDREFSSSLDSIGATPDVKSTDPSYSGKGGPGADISMLDVAAAQNKNLTAQIDRQKKNMHELLTVIEGRNNRLSTLPDLWPTDGGVISSYYGGRTGPINGGFDWHPGLDIAVDIGTPVYAAAMGTVDMAGWNGGYGQFVKIRHGNGYESAYGHMSGIAVSAGQQVRKGEIIGFVGSTGYSTGPHLHFEVFVDGENIDPLYMLKKAK